MESKKKSTILLFFSQLFSESEHSVFSTLGLSCPRTCSEGLPKPCEPLVFFTSLVCSLVCSFVCAFVHARFSLKS